MDKDATPAAASSAHASIIVESDESGAAYIWLNRPERMNALSVEMVAAFSAALREALAAGATALVLRGRGRAFCSGADLKQRLEMSDADRRAHNRAIDAAVKEVAAAPVPSIAVLNGAAMGGGLELALACDIRLAAEGAEIGLTEARIGAIPGAGGTQRLPRLIGISRALEMMYTGETVTAQKALAIGLVNICVPAGELDTAVAKYMRVLGSRSPATARVLKTVVIGGFATSLEEGLRIEGDAIGKILGSTDYAEGIAAFAERRAPRFSR